MANNVNNVNNANNAHHSITEIAGVDDIAGGDPVRGGTARAVRSTDTDSRPDAAANPELGQLLMGALTTADCATAVSSTNAPAAGAVVGTFSGWSEDGPTVQFPGNPTAAPLPARSTVDLRGAEAGCDVVLMFDRGDLARPIVMGLLQPQGRSEPDPPQRDDPSPSPWEASVDQERLVLSAGREIELRCGKASIVLTKAGKILLRGAYVLSRSSGANRIKGASVQIN